MTLNYGSRGRSPSGWMRDPAMEAMTGSTVERVQVRGLGLRVWGLGLQGQGFNLRWISRSWGIPKP